MRRKVNRQDEPGSGERDEHVLKPAFRAALEAHGPDGYAVAIARLHRKDRQRAAFAITEYDVLRGA